MKRHWKITIGIAAMGGICGFLLLRSDNSAQQAAKETRRVLREEGFKTDLSDFNFSTSAEFRAREAALTNFTFDRMGRTQEDYARHRVLQGNEPNLMAVVGTNAAIVVWKTEPIPDPRTGEMWSGNFWTVLREALEDYQPELDAACAAALSGPIRFDLDASGGNAMLLRHCGMLKNLSQTLGRRVVLALHDRNNDAAWTNLLAATRLVTAWDLEPAEVSHLVRFACATIAFNATWQALQAHGWTDGQLAKLQEEWASVDFFKGLPETAAFARASAVATCQLERKQPVGVSGFILKQVFRSPRQVWSYLNDYFRRLSYRRHGSYEDEKALLLHYRDREVELRRAVQSITWAEMRPLPGVTNQVLFLSKHPSAMQCMLNQRQMMLSMQGEGRGLLGRAADAETRRRLILTVVALERHRIRHDSYPKTLQELAPDFLKSPPTDFMDGQPLRYRLTGDGHFVLHSVGLDCTDDGGKLQQQRQREAEYGTPFGRSRETDIIWPRPATVTEIEAKGEEDRLAELQRAEEREQAAEVERQEEALQRARTLARLEQLSRQKPPRRLDEPTLKGQPFSKVLRNPKAAGTNQLTLDEMLTLRQIFTGQEPDIATFEVPVSFDALTNIGMLRLLVDADPDGDSPGDGAELQACLRAPNGNCRLVWNTTYDPPGKHFLQAHLYLMRVREETRELRGPLAIFVSTNICQFDSFYSGFDSKGAILYARLPESNGTYTIELKSPAGERVKTITGTTSNGVIEVR